MCQEYILFFLAILMLLFSMVIFCATTIEKERNNSKMLLIMSALGMAFSVTGKETEGANIGVFVILFLLNLGFFLIACWLCWYNNR